MSTLSNSICTAFMLAFLVLMPMRALSQPSSSYKYSPPAKLNDGIDVSSLKAAKLDEAKIVAGTNEILKGTYPNIHSLLIFRHGKLVYENYFKGDDYERGVGPLGVVTHTRETLHDMRSVTKSVVAIAVLKALSQRKIKSLDQPIFEIFPEYSRHFDGHKKRITIKHLLTMTAGLKWNEDVPGTDPENSEIQMNRSSNPIDYVFSRPSETEPGRVFRYAGGCTQLLAEIVRVKTGQPIDVYAAEHIFRPLGITYFKWVRESNGYPSAASGLRLRSRDISKIGQTMMNDGKWKGKRILPEHLVREAFRPHIRAPFPVPDGHVDYGYQIWLPTQIVNGVQVSTAEFEGNGGQIVIFDKTNGLMVAVTAGNYNRRDQAKNSADLFLEIILPAIIRP